MQFVGKPSGFCRFPDAALMARTAHLLSDHPSAGLARVTDGQRRRGEIGDEPVLSDFVISPLISPGEPFETHEFADLVVDRVYRGGPQPNWAADPLGRLLPVGLQGGIRVSGGQQVPRLVALATSGASADWPDSIDTATGTVTYYGDNRHPGSELHDTPKGGNRVLRATFDWAHADAATRRNVPPYFLFAKAGPGRDIVFRGVLAPGAPELTADEDLVAVWRSQHGLRFQNYRAQFTILDVATATRAWIKDILAGDPLSANCPGPWRRWITGRHYQALTSTRIEYRSKSEQLPETRPGCRSSPALGRTSRASRRGLRPSPHICGRWPTGTSAPTKSLARRSTAAATRSVNIGSGPPPTRSPLPSLWKPSFTTPQEAGSVSAKWPG